MAQTLTTQIRRVTHITVIVDDQDEALQFYAQAFGTEVRSDTMFQVGGHEMRWVTIGIPGDDLEIAVTLPMPGPDGRIPEVGDNNMVVLEATDVDAACKAVEAAGGTIDSAPEDLPWGRSAVVRDLDGNPFNLVTPND